MSIVRFTSTAVNVDSELGSKICAMYPPPRAHTFSLTQSTIEERRLTRYNYKPRMHELLYVEEMARYEQVSLGGSVVYLCSLTSRTVFYCKIDFYKG